MAKTTKPQAPAPKPPAKGEVKMGGKGPIQRVQPRKGIDTIPYGKRNQYT